MRIDVEWKRTVRIVFQVIHHRSSRFDGVPVDVPADNQEGRWIAYQFRVVAPLIDAADMTVPLGIVITIPPVDELHDFTEVLF